MCHDRKRGNSKFKIYKKYLKEKMEMKRNYFPFYHLIIMVYVLLWYCLNLNYIQSFCLRIFCLNITELYKLYRWSLRFFIGVILIYIILQVVIGCIFRAFANGVQIDPWIKSKKNLKDIMRLWQAVIQFCATN